MGNTSITTGPRAPVFAESIVGRFAEEAKPIDLTPEDRPAGAVGDRSSSPVQDTADLVPTGDDSRLSLDSFPPAPGAGSGGAGSTVRPDGRDAILLDLNRDGDTNAIARQAGIEVDGGLHTYWAEKGDGVLAFADKPIDTVDSQGGVHESPYDTLKVEAERAGIDTSKGYLDESDIATLEAQGLTLMVSNGDGTNQSVKPSELGITRLGLGGTAVDKRDTVGNLITTEGSYVRDGKTELAQHMDLLDIPTASGGGGTVEDGRPVGAGDATGGDDVDFPQWDPMTLSQTVLAKLDPELLDQIYRKRAAAMKGEVDCSPIRIKNPTELMKGLGFPNATPGQAQEFVELVKKGMDPEAAAAQATRPKGDPLVFDLNGDGDTDATVDQRGIEVDGMHATKWAEKGDGVLSMGGNPIDTVDSKGVKHKDAFETLKAEAEYAGIDVSKGYLDAADFKVLEGKGLTMLVSNGDGTNQSIPPSELGITRMSLGGKAVDKTDSVGNSITAEGSFERNGQTQLVNDMWFNQI